jgi:hypothetical protein
LLKIARIVVATLALLASGNVVGAEEGNGQLLKGKAAFGGWQQDKPGVKRLFTLEDLPPVGTSTSNWVEVVPRPPAPNPRSHPAFQLTR